MIKPKGAVRHDEGKVPYAYLPMDLLAGAARVMEFGAQKYTLNNYRKGYESFINPLSSLMRHATAVQTALLEYEGDGRIEGLTETLLDNESGLTHLDHAITSALLLIHSVNLHIQAHKDAIALTCTGSALPPTDVKED